MDDLRTRALLGDYDPARIGAGAIGTVISRAEVADTAARGEFPATLLLDLERVERTEAGEVTAHASLAVEWDEDTLQQLLATTEDEKVALWFDGDALAPAFEDVEAHGLREKAALLVVVAAAAGAAAPTAFGSLEAGGGGGGGGGAAQAPVSQPMGVERGLQQDAQIAVTPAQSTQVSQPMGVERGLQQDANITVTPSQGTEVTSTGDSTLSTGELAGIAGAAGALVISAAGFGIARKRERPVQPA
jgi:hypothetical protein